MHLGSDATERRLKAVGGRSAASVRYLHVAAHGVLDSSFPMNSALALTPASAGDTDDNGFLQAWEIYEQFRVDADLVTLSACETAVGEDAGGEGLISLSRAFLYAGAKSVVASLWRVRDDSTAALMTRFYGKPKRGSPIRGASRRAGRPDSVRGASASGRPRATRSLVTSPQLVGIRAYRRRV